MTRNRFETRCYRCGKKVGAWEGTLTMESFPGQRWKQLKGTTNISLVEHDSCAAKYAGTNVHFVFSPLKHSR